MIYTFYSYKGGVGRSMAMANIAEWFYEQGLRVVIVDWDLEAPGIESFFVAPEEVEKARTKPGVIDLLLAYKDHYPFLPLTAPAVNAPPAGVAASAVSAGLAAAVSAAAPDTYLWERGPEGPPPSAGLPPLPRKLDTREALEVLDKHLPPLAYMLYPLRPPDRLDGKKRALWLLSAGWRTKDRFTDYGQAVHSFSWSDFYESYHGEAYFEWMRRQLTSPDLADVVLIDSRTGLTEMGGVCTRQLADVVVSFTSPNIQSLSGVARMSASFKKKQVTEARNKLAGDGLERPLEVVVVPTRVESSELAERARFRKEFEKQLGEFPAAFRVLKRTFWELAIPYVSKYAYIERLAIGDPEGAEELQSAYKNLAAHLVLLAPEGSAVRSRFADELRRVFGRLLPRVLLFDGQHERDQHLGLLQRLREAGISVLSRYGEEAGAEAAAPHVAGSFELFEFVVMPVTRESVRSASFRRQWQHARQHGVCVQLIESGPARLEESDLPLWLRGVRILDPVGEWEELLKTLERPCIASRVPHMAPEPPADYVERRRELDEVVGALVIEGRPGRVGLCGPPGSGKSALARAVCHDERVLAAFGDGILWVTLGENPDPATELGKLYVALVGEGPRPTDVEGLASATAAKLEGRRCLLVVDDVYAESDLRPFLQVAGNGSLLFTTRDQSLTVGAGSTRVVIGEVTDEEAVSIFAARAAAGDDTRRKIGEIADMFSRSPLVARLAATAYLERVRLGGDPAAALAYVRDELHKRGVVAFDQRGATERDQSVARCVGASLSRLEEAERHSYTKLAALPAETPVPLSDITVLWGQNESDAASLAARFASLSLLDYDPDTKSVRLSRLMRAFLAAQQRDPAILNARAEGAEALFARLTAEEQTTARRVLTRLVHLARPEDKLPDVPRPAELEKFDAQSKALIKVLEGGGVVVQGGEDAKRATVQLADDSLLQGWNRLRAWLEESRRFLLWRQSLEMNIAEWEGSRRHNSTVLLKGRELAAARKWRDTHKDDLNESEKLYIGESERVELAHRRKLRRELGVIFVSVIVVIAGLWAYSRYRSRKEAETLEILGSARVAELELKNPINEADPKLSENAYRDAIDKYNMLIKTTPDYPEAYYGLGDVYASMSQAADTPEAQNEAFEKAVENFQQALKLKPDYAAALAGLGSAYKLKGDRGDAASYDAAIQAYSRVIGLTPNDAEAYYGRGEVYRAKGERGDKESYDLAVADFTRIIAQLRHATAEVYFKRGLSYRGKGDHQNAVADLQKALDLPGDDNLRVNAQAVLNDLKVNPPPPQPTASPRIFIQYNNEDDEMAISKLVADLKAKGYQVVGRPQLTARRAYRAGDVRCFNESDRQNAANIARAVEESLDSQGFSRKIEVRWLNFSRNVPLGNIEVWIPPLWLPTDAPEDDISR